MSSLKNKLPLKTFGLVYPFEIDFKCHNNTIAPGHLIYKKKFLKLFEILCFNHKIKLAITLVILMLPIFFFSYIVQNIS